MTAPVPIGWSSSRLNMHYKTVSPGRNETGMYFNLHKNVRKQLLPKEIRQETQSVEAARKILHRHKQVVRSQRTPKSGYRRLFTRGARSEGHASEPTIRLCSSPDAMLRSPRSLYFPPLSKGKPMTPASRYTADDINKIVTRLSTYDPVKIPESRGHVVKLPSPIVYKKKYSDLEVRDIVDRLSEYDPDRGPPESREVPIIVQRLPRQSMVPPQKCTSDEVQDIVERLCSVHFDQTPSRLPTRQTIGTMEFTASR